MGVIKRVRREVDHALLPMVKHVSKESYTHLRWTSERLSTNVSWYNAIAAVAKAEDFKGRSTGRGSYVFQEEVHEQSLTDVRVNISQQLLRISVANWQMFHVTPTCRYSKPCY